MTMPADRHRNWKNTSGTSPLVACVRDGAFCTWKVSPCTFSNWRSCTWSPACANRTLYPIWYYQSRYIGSILNAETMQQHVINGKCEPLLDPIHTGNPSSILIQTRVVFVNKLCRLLLSRRALCLTCAKEQDTLSNKR